MSEEQPPAIPARTGPELSLAAEVLADRAVPARRYERISACLRAGACPDERDRAVILLLVLAGLVTGAGLDDGAGWDAGGLDAGAWDGGADAWGAAGDFGGGHGSDYGGGWDGGSPG